MKILFFIFVIMFIVQWILKQKQLKGFYRHYNAFIQKGDVLVGRYKGIYAGGISLLQLSKKGKIEKAITMKGMSPFAKFSCLPKLEGMYITEINEIMFSKMKKYERRSLENAIDNWKEAKQENTTTPNKQYDNYFLK